jgi:hypothetical protein
MDVDIPVATSSVYALSKTLRWARLPDGSRILQQIGEDGCGNPLWCTVPIVDLSKEDEYRLWTVNYREYWP